MSTTLSTKTSTETKTTSALPSSFARNESKNSIIFHLCTVGDLKSLTTHYRYQDITDAIDKNGSTPLHYSAGSGHVNICIFILEHNLISIHSKSKRNLRSPLHWSARNGHFQLCEIFVRNFHANVDEKGKGDVTPLQLAVWQCQMETVKKLIDLGANPRLVNSWGCATSHWLGLCPLYAAATAAGVNADNHHRTNTQQTRTRSTIETYDVHDDGMTSDWGTKVESQESDDNDADEDNKCCGKECCPRSSSSPFTMTALEKRILECCHYLHNECNVSFDGNVTNNHGQTPLHKAGYSGNIPMLSFLVYDLGIVDDKRDNMGNNAADCAERNGNIDAATWLRRNASPLLRNSLLRLGFSPSWNSYKKEQEVDIVGAKPNTSFLRTRNNNNTQLDTLPPLHEIRRAYLNMAKLYHPDKSIRERWMTKTTMTMQANAMPKAKRHLQFWYEAQAAYILLSTWYTNPSYYDTIMRFQSRNAALIQHKRLMWLSSWHNEELREKSNTSIGLKSDSLRIRIREKDSRRRGSRECQSAILPLPCLQEFETRLLILLRTFKTVAKKNEAAVSVHSQFHDGLPIDQLPRQYEKNFHDGIPMPKPKNYGCRKLIQLIRLYCPRVLVECDDKENNSVPILRAAPVATDMV